MNKAYNFSIIIPHYNIPELLVRCLNSIPVREDVQVIVVDDCSPCQEQTFQMLQDQEIPHLEWYSTPIGGSAGRARNVGLEHAKGKWLIFIDADDLFSEDASMIFDKSIDREEDILFYDSRAVMSDNLNVVSRRNIYSGLFAHCEDEEYDKKFRYTFDSLWGKLYRLDFIKSNSIRCDDTRYANDAYFSFSAGLHAEKIYKSRDVLCVITEREESLSSSQRQTRIISKEECKIRYGVVLRIYELNRKYHTGFVSNDVYFYLEKFRKHYKPYYLYLLFSLLFSHPRIVAHEIKGFIKPILT